MDEKEIVSREGGHNSYYFMGGITHKVSMTLFAENRRRLCQQLRDLNCHCVTGGLVLLQGGKALNLYSTDVEYVFRQESYFHWAFGVVEPDCYGAIVVLTGESLLFVPRLPDEYANYMGKPMSLCDFKRKYECNLVAYVDQMKHVLERIVRPPNVILAMRGRNSDSGLSCEKVHFEGIKEFKVDFTILFDVISECRVIKTPAEIEVIRYANQIASEGHKMVMRKIKPGMKEYQCEAIFLYYAYFVGGCRGASYIPICSSGENASVLHYGQSDRPNAKTIQDGEMCLFDMGCHYYGYASDIACSFPANGKFTKDQALIYNAVLNANRAVLKAAKPGVEWARMHLLANQVMLSDLQQGGLLTGEVEDMLDSMLAAVFQPHGLGHFLGCDVHDVGGYLAKDPRPPVGPGLCKLRTARTLKSGMVITVEPGCYFIPKLIDKALEDPALKKFIVPSVLERFRHFGGVRIEDVIVVTDKGNEILSRVPRSVQEIEEWMRQSECDDLTHLRHSSSSLQASRVLTNSIEDIKRT